MPYQIAFAWSDKCEKELIERGFKKREIYIKEWPHTGVNSDEMVKDGNKDFFDMYDPPWQFITTTYWGAGCEFG